MNARTILVRVMTVLCLGCAVAAADGWKRLDDCRLLADPSNDGDSFHVKHGRKEWLFRLYFVDAPETSDRFPDRVKEQAAYFNVDMAAALQGGEAATAWVRSLLNGKRFTVYTRGEDARGGSQMKRHFAMVEIDGRFLSEMLVENGLARIYGLNRDLPNGLSSRQYEAKLKVLEKEAKWRRKGLWSGGSLAVKGWERELDVDKVIATVRIKQRAAFYTDGAMPTFRGTLEPGTQVQVLELDREIARVRTVFRGKVETGSCRRYDLGL